MANVDIITAGPSDVPVLTELYNEIFRPSRDAAFFKRRFLGRYNVALLLAHLDGRPVGFVAGFELKPTTYYVWLCGVLPDFRGLGVAGQLLDAMDTWAAEHAYVHVRMECHNRHREMLRLAIDAGYDIIGVRWDPERADTLIVFERTLSDGT